MPISSLGQVFAHKFNSLVEKIKVEITSRLSDSAQIYTLEKPIVFEQGVGYGVCVDSSTGYQLIVDLDNSLNLVLNEVFQNIERQSLEWYALEMYIPRLIIFPLINGRMLFPTAYQFKNLTLVSDDIPFALQTLSSDILDQLREQGINLHKGEVLDVSNKFYNLMSESLVSVAHLYDLRHVPTIKDKEIGEFAISYVSQISEKISESKEKSREIFALLVKGVESFRFEDQANLIDCTGAINKIWDYQIFSDPSDLVFQLDELEPIYQQFIEIVNCSYWLSAILASEQRYD